MVSKKATDTLPTFSQNTVFEVRSKCSSCGSFLRSYNKITKETKCYQCGKKQPNPKQDLNNLETDNSQIDLSVLEEERNAFCQCKKPNGWFDSKDGNKIVCQKCGKEIDNAEPNLKTAEITLTNKTQFFRKKGLPCPNCNSTHEALEVIGNNHIRLYCTDCMTSKGKDDFREWNIETGGDTA